MRALDRLPLWLLLLGTLTLGLAPFSPEPHLVEKLRMLFAGTLVRPLDLFDLVLHGAFPALLFLRLVRLPFRRAPDHA